MAKKTAKPDPTHGRHESNLINNRKTRRVEASLQAQVKALAERIADLERAVFADN